MATGSTGREYYWSPPYLNVELELKPGRLPLMICETGEKSVRGSEDDETPKTGELHQISHLDRLKFDGIVREADGPSF